MQSYSNLPPFSSRSSGWANRTPKALVNDFTLGIQFLLKDWSLNSATFFKCLAMFDDNRRLFLTSLPSYWRVQKTSGMRSWPWNWCVAMVDAWGMLQLLQADTLFNVMMFMTLRHLKPILQVASLAHHSVYEKLFWPTLQSFTSYPFSILKMGQLRIKCPS